MCAGGADLKIRYGGCGGSKAEDIKLSFKLEETGRRNEEKFWGGEGKSW